MSTTRGGRFHLRASLKVRLGPARAYAAATRGRLDAIPRFLILTSGRTGSELLVSLLDSHPQIACEGELLKHTHRWPNRLVAGRVARSRRRGAQAYGFKLQPQHILDMQELPDAATWVRSMSSQGWHVIRLRRLNRLHQAISVVRRETTPGHHRHDSVSPYEPMAIDPMVLIGTMCLITHSEQRIDDLLKDVEHLELSYEHDLQQADAQVRTAATICQLIGLEPHIPSTDLVRITPDDARSMVTNYDEIADVIRRNRFAEYLTD